MHISLDSALGRQRRLNSVGESVLQIAPNAAAAYSLRSLTGGSPKVVRVRRASDNGERDFTSAEINSGEMVSWVNRQVVAPLDIQELEADGRTGDFLIAKAAYALRSLGTRQATLAATGDTVARADGKFVAQVRRNVNGDLKSFTATEVTDGTLESFVNESFTSSLPLDVAGSAAAAYGLRNLGSGYSGNVVEVRRSSDDNPRDFTAAEITDGTLLAFVGTGGSDNGFVKTWYDQSGNSKHAVQTAPDSQPKIVSAGVLLNELDFDGTDDVLETSVVPPNAATLIGVASWDVLNSTQLIVGARDSTNKRSYLGLQSTNVSVLGNATGTLTGGSISAGADFLLFGVHAVDKRLLSTNGTVVSNTSGSASDNTTRGYSIGGFNNAGTNSSFVNGKVSEVIIYASDQSDNRRAIEESIASHHGITLASFNRDGFVKTWYDQSVTNEAGDTATGNHATQATAASQPKIVSAGSLVTDSNNNPEIDFNGSNKFDFVNTTDSSSPYTVLSVSKVRDTGTNVIYGVDTGTTAGYYRQTGTTHAIYSGGGVTGSAFAINTDYLRFDLFNGSSSVIGVNGDTTNVSLDDDRPNTGFAIAFSGVNTDQPIDGTIKEIILYQSDQTVNRTAIEANIGEAYSITGIPAYDDEVDGFVETWYDQSGNGRDATQATAGNQPQIVNAGSLVTEGLLFNGTSNYLSATISPYFTSNDCAMFSVSNWDGGGGGADGRRFIVEPTSPSSDVFQPALTIASGSSPQELIAYAGKLGAFHSVTSSNYSSGTDILASYDKSGDTLSLYTNGVLQGSDDFDATPLPSANGINIGTYRLANNRWFSGNITELVIYPTGQSSNRTAIEANIAAKYGITLS